MNFDELDERAINEAHYIIENNATIRQTATKFGISKSAVHKDVSYKLQYINQSLYLTCKRVIDQNLKERHIRGGLATKRKFERLNKG